MKSFIISDWIDRFISTHYISFLNEKSSLMIYCFHGLFKDKNEISLNYVRPMERILIDRFRQFVEYHLDNNFEFISPNNILDGLKHDKKYVLITFDDGYANNQLTIPILHEFKVPAVFFISSRNIENNHCFWWDVVHRERVKQNLHIGSIKEEQLFLKQKEVYEIEKYIIDNFGDKALNPVSDIDRPLTPSELRSLSKDPYVSLGNHTANHNLLTNCSPSQIRSEINLTQEYIFTLTGISPIIIAYPYGVYSEDVITISRESGLRLGVTTSPHKNYLPISLRGVAPFLLNRFMLRGNKDIKKQCDFNRSDFRFKETVSKLVKRVVPEK